MRKESVTFMLLVILVFSVVLGFAVQPDEEDYPDRINQFESEEEFENFMADNEGFLRNPVPVISLEGVEITDMASRSSSVGAQDESKSQTNLQVSGIDEPDILKMSDDTLYYSLPERYPTILPSIARTDVLPPEPTERDTKVIRAENASQPRLVDSINQSGELLRSQNRLIIFNDRSIVAYDISNKGDPRKVWTKRLPDNTNIESARMTGNNVFFVFTTITENCTVAITDEDSVNCTEIQYPKELNSASGVYSVLEFNGKSGDLVSGESIAGSSRGTVVYMSRDSIYLSYQKDDPLVDDYLEQGIDDLDVSDSVRESVSSINTSSINDRYGFRRELESSLNSKGDYKLINKITDSYTEFIGDNSHKKSQTVVVRLDTSGNTLDPQASPGIPGHILNQYSFSQNGGDMRLATTVPRSANNQSTNNMYVLDKETMEIQGSVVGMAEGQRVYAVRYVGDRGYVITFRQVDPLHVIDLSDPSDPKELGNLQLPGFSDYLHNVGEGKLLGIGESSDSRAKVVLFDVSEDSNPKVSDSIILEDEYTTRVSENFRSFLEDPINGNYYIPASGGAYVISEDDGSLSIDGLVETPTSAERVRVLEDKIYVFHRNGVVVSDRQTYKMENSLTFK